jgi:WD40 repeat protein
VNGLGFDSLAFSPDERMIATGHVEGVIRMWNRHDGSLIQKIKGNISSIHSLQFTSDGRHIISGGRDKSIRIFSATDGSEVARVESDRSIGGTVRLTPDGRRLITAGGYCYDAQTDKWLADGDYDIHIWQLPESVCPELSRSEEETGREESRDESQPNDNE